MRLNTALLLLLPLTGCAVEPGEYRYGDDLTQLEFLPYTQLEGVHPDVSVMSDPNNPFSDGIGTDTKWDVLTSGPVHGFYAFATSLVQVPTGEHQLYTASAAHQIYDQELAAPGDLWLAREIAVKGYRQVLETFTDDVTYDATGTYFFAVAPIAYNGLLDLGGDTTGYALITTDSGEQAVVTVP